MSNLVTKNCDHKTCEKLYATDSNHWWWAYRKHQVIMFGMFNGAALLLFKENGVSISMNENCNEVMHFCGQEHLMSWVNENVGRINESRNEVSTSGKKEK